MDLYVSSQATRPLKHAQNLAFLRAEPWNLTKAQFFGMFPGVFADSDNFQAITGSAVNTAGVVVWNADKMLILSKGTIGLSQAQAMSDSWLRGIAYPNDTTQPAVFPNAFAQYISQCPAIANGSYTQVTMVGHSFGGGTVMAGAALMNGFHREINREVYTYGAPRVSYREGFANWHGVFVVRVWLTNDPVINIPPHVSEIPLIGARLRTAESTNMNRIWHPVGGLILSNDGNFSPSEDGAINPVYEIVPLAEWLLGTNVFSSPEHSLDLYVAAVNNAVAMVPQQVALMAPSHGDARPQLPANQLRALIGRALQTAGSITQADVETAALDIISRVTIVPGEKFRKRTVYGVRTVSYAGAAVASTPKKRFQKKIIRRLNQMLPGRGIG